MNYRLLCFAAACLVAAVSFGEDLSSWGVGGFRIATTDEDSIGPKCVARVKAVYRERGVTLTELTSWGWWLKPQTADLLEIGKRRLPSDNSGLFPSEPYRGILDSLGGTDGYAILRDTSDPHIVYIFGARDAGTIAATEDFLANGYTGDKIVRTGPPERDADRWTDEGRVPASHVGGRGTRPAPPQETVFPPTCWIFDRNREGTTLTVKSENDATYLEIVQAATATNTCRIKAVVGDKYDFKEYIPIPRYGAAVFEVEADSDWSGGQLVFVGPGWKGGGSVAVSGGYEKPCHSWNAQRSNLIGNFHTGEDQKLALQANPRRKVPANVRVALTNSLSLAWLDAVPTHTASIVNFDLPVNDTGRTRTIKLHAVKFIEEVTDDEYLDRAKAFDAKLAAYEPDYSDSSKDAQVPETNRLPQPFAVVTGGVAAASVVLPEGDVSPCLETAAAELVKYVKEITGVTLPIVRGGGGAGRASLPAVRLGFGTFDAAHGKDGYRISSVDGDLCIDGGNDKGVMNGVYALLENNTDIIWAHPDEAYGTIFTPSPGELTFLWGDGYEAVPETPGRGWNGYLMLEWMAHNQCDIYNCGGGGDITWMNAKKSKYGVLYTRHFGGHNIFQFMAGAPTNAPVGYYACNEAGERTGGNPCFSSPALLELFVTNVLSTLRYAPDGTDEIYINLQDTWKSCLCKNCRAPIVFGNGVRVEPTDENFFSTRYFLFMNRVAEAVRREFPTKRITTLAYFGSLPAPSCKLHPNLTPEFAPYPRNNAQTPLYHPDNRLHVQHLDDWYDLAGPNRLEVYGYHGIGLGFPRPISETAVEDFKLLNARTIGISSEFHERDSVGEWDYGAIEYWTMTRLMWDTAQDVERLRKRFIRRTFREAAPPMERFYGTIRREYCRQAVKMPGSTSLAAGTLQLIVKPRHVRELRAYLAEAKSLAAHPKSQEMLARIETRFEAGVTAAKASALKDADELADRIEDADPREVIKLAPGTYKLTETLMLTNAVTLQSTGSWRDTVIEPADGFTGRLCFLQAPDQTAANRPLVKGVTFRGTDSTRTGGQAYVKFPGGTFEDCRFTGCITRGNSALAGGVVAMEGGGSLRRCVVDHNQGVQTTANNGQGKSVAGVFLLEGSTTKNVGGLCVENCLIVQNDGEGIRYGNITYYNPMVRNCTIADNDGYVALAIGRESNVKNNILLVSSNRLHSRDNAVGAGASSRKSTRYYNNFYPVTPGPYSADCASFYDNVIGHEAMFVNPAGMDYHLKAGSPCIDAGCAFDGSGATDLDGKPRTSGEATDIGCYEYDPAYVATIPTLYVAPSGDDAADGTREAPLRTPAKAVAQAADGTEIRLLPGVYPLTATLTVDKPVKLIGEGGRDRTFLEPAAGASAFALLRTQHPLAEVRGLTIRNGRDATMVTQTAGGVIEDCRLTGFYSEANRVFDGMAWYGEWGTLYRCVIDGNFHKENKLTSAAFCSGRRDDNLHASRGGVLDTCLLTENEVWFMGGKGKTTNGKIVTLTRNGTCTGEPSVLRNCTVISNTVSRAVDANRFASSIRNNILWGAVSLEDNASLRSRVQNNCAPTEVGTNCETNPPTFKHPRKGDYTPRADASVVGKAAPLLFAEDDLDLNGRPRKRKDGTQDIGCNQNWQPGILLLLK